MRLHARSINVSSKQKAYKIPQTLYSLEKLKVILFTIVIIIASSQSTHIYEGTGDFFLNYY